MSRLHGVPETFTTGVEDYYDYVLGGFNEDDEEE